jgi:rhodanese-related sulfurtransferase
MENHSITAVEFVEKFVNGDLDQTEIIDVREPYEWEMYHLEKAKLIPMNTIPEHTDQLRGDKTIFLVCAHGVRSWHVMNYLLQNGVNNVVNVEGGMAEVYSLLQSKNVGE